VTSALALAIRVALDLTLIPFLGFLGPCVAFMASEALAVGVWMARMSRMGSPVRIWQTIWRPLAAASCMAIVLRLVGGGSVYRLAAGMVLSTAVYFAVLIKSGAFSKSDLDLASEGLRFVRPFLAKWTGQPQRNPT